MTVNRLTMKALPIWHQEMIASLLKAKFPGKSEIIQQLATAKFEIMDSNKSLGIFPIKLISAPVEKTIPVEAIATDEDGVLIQVLLFTRNGVVYMLEILREDGLPVNRLPSVEKFEVMVLSP